MIAIGFPLLCVGIFLCGVAVGLRLRLFLVMFRHRRHFCGMPLGPLFVDGGFIRFKAGL